MMHTMTLMVMMTVITTLVTQRKRLLIMTILKIMMTVMTMPMMIITGRMTEMIMMIIGMRSMMRIPHATHRKIEDAIVTSTVIQTMKTTTASHLITLILTLIIANHTDLIAMVHQSIIVSEVVHRALLVLLALLHPHLFKFYIRVVVSNSWHKASLHVIYKALYVLWQDSSFCWILNANVERTPCSLRNWA